MYFRFDYKIFSLFLLLLFQILSVLFYIVYSSTWKLSENGQENPKPIRIVGSFDQFNKVDLGKYKNYYNSEVDEEIYLKTDLTESYYTLVNDRICFRIGTDIRHMKRSTHEYDNKCECLPGYHSNDCSIPEVIWRAFIALRQNTIITKRSKTTRRLVYMLHVEHPAHIQHVIITINELFDTIDFFVVSETNQTENGDSKQFYFKEKLDKGTLKELQHKIFYVPIYVKKNNNINNQMKSVKEIVMEKLRKIVKNLNGDDIFLDFDNNEIPNSKSLLFFKLFDGFSLPISFRLKWNVYGYFYQHPMKTKTSINGITYDMLKNDIKPNVESFVIGDLNHYGGWFCDLCYNPNDVLNVIQSFNYENLLKENSNNIDVTYIEELFGDGRYIDGKTNLIKLEQDDSENYSPIYVSNNTWKYDSLLINYYNKIDYN